MTALCQRNRGVLLRNQGLPCAQLPHCACIMHIRKYSFAPILKLDYILDRFLNDAFPISDPTGFGACAGAKNGTRWLAHWRGSPSSPSGSLLHPQPPLADPHTAVHGARASSQRHACAPPARAHPAADRPAYARRCECAATNSQLKHTMHSRTLTTHSARIHRATSAVARFAAPARATCFLPQRQQT